jgi:SOS response regulatory protein OraA/RecX
VTGQRARRPRESYAERRAQRAAIDDPEVVLAAAFRFLEARARSVAETRRRLSDAGYRTDLIDSAVARLLEIGLLDDEAFARHWIESRDRARPRGTIALKRELRLRGVDGAIVDAALDERRVESLAPGASGAAGAEDCDEGMDGRASLGVDPDEAAARRLLDRRRRDLDRVSDPRKRRARAYALLARNGFGPEIAARLASALDGSNRNGDTPADPD